MTATAFRSMTGFLRTAQPGETFDEVRTGDRRMTRYTMVERREDGDDVGGVLRVVTTSHNKDAKAYVARVSEYASMTTREPSTTGFECVTSDLSAGLRTGRVLLRVPAARYNAKNLGPTHLAALELV